LPDDHELWKQIQRGNTAAFDEFYREYAPRLKAFLRHLVGSSETAEDIVQETFTKIWNRPNGFQPERGSLRAYVYGIGRKCAAEWWRQQKPLNTVVNYEANCCESEVASILTDAFERLADDQQMLLWLREVEGLSYAELADCLEIPVGTVRSRLFTAREALRKIWGTAQKEVKEAI
jgi:RNA polymerase sigma-70 factor, ECF subfamily